MLALRGTLKGLKWRVGKVRDGKWYFDAAPPAGWPSFYTLVGLRYNVTNREVSRSRKQLVEYCDAATVRLAFFSRLGAAPGALIGEFLEPKDDSDDEDGGEDEGDEPDAEESGAVEGAPPPTLAAGRAVRRPLRATGTGGALQAGDHAKTSDGIIVKVLASDGVECKVKFLSRWQGWQMTVRTAELCAFDMDEGRLTRSHGSFVTSVSDLRVGSRVAQLFRDGKAYAGTVTAVHRDGGSFDLAFDDGDDYVSVPALTLEGNLMPAPSPSPPPSPETRATRDLAPWPAPARETDDAAAPDADADDDDDAEPEAFAARASDLEVGARVCVKFCGVHEKGKVIDYHPSTDEFQLLFDNGECFALSRKQLASNLVPPARDVDSQDDGGGESGEPTIAVGTSVQVRAFQQTSKNFVLNGRRATIAKDRGFCHGERGASAKKAHRFDVLMDSGETVLGLARWHLKVVDEPAPKKRRGRPRKATNKDDSTPPSKKPRASWPIAPLAMADETDVEDAPWSGDFSPRSWPETPDDAFINSW